MPQTNERVQILNKLLVKGKAENELLTMVLMMLNLTPQQEDDNEIMDRKPLSIYKKEDLDNLLKMLKPALKFTVQNKMNNNKAGEDEEIPVELKFENMKDFGPEQIAKQVPQLEQMIRFRSILKDFRSDLTNIPKLKKALYNMLNDQELAEDLKNDAESFLKKFMKN